MAWYCNACRWIVQARLRVLRLVILRCKDMKRLLQESTEKTLTGLQRLNWVLEHQARRMHLEDCLRMLLLIPAMRLRDRLTFLIITQAVSDNQALRGRDCSRGKDSDMA